MDVKEFKDNPLWGVVGEAQTLAKSLDPDIAAELTERVNGVAAWVNRFRGLADTRMFTASMLGTSQQQWSQLNNYLASIANSSGYVQHANNQLDAITTNTAGWPQPWTSNKLSQAMQEQLADFAEQVEDLRRGHVEHVEALDAELLNRDRELSELKKQATALGTKLAEQEQAISNQLTNQTTTFNATLTERSQEFTDWIDQRKADLAQLRTANAADLDSALAEAKTVLAEVEKVHASVEAVASKAGSAVLARDFNGYAKQQMRSSWVAFVVGLLLVGVAGVFLFLTASSVGPEVHATWQWVVIKVGIAATIVGGASFALTLGNRFLKNSTTAKRLELELRVLGPFLAEMEPDRAQEILSNFADRSFGRPWDSPEPTKGKDEDAVNINALAQLGEVAAKFVAATQKAN